MSISNTLPGAEKLDSDLLRTFIAISDTGSFTKGADRIYRSQSAVSLQIKRLETILGQPVFKRHARGVVLTQIGEKLRPVAQRIIDTLDSTIGELRATGLNGSIRIGIPDEYGETILPQVIAEFARNHPQVEVNVQCGFSAGFPEALKRNELDLAVYATESPIKGTMVLRQEKTHWVTSKNHLAHEQDPVPIALFDRACWWRDRTIEALENSDKRYKVIYTSESVTGVMAAISVGVAVGVMSEGTLRDDLAILTRADGFPNLPQSSLIIGCSDKAQSSLSEAMTSAIRQAFQNQ